MDFPAGFTAQQVASCISPRRLDLTILPTEKCNFRCTYCYEDFAIGRMPAHIQAGVMRLMDRRAPELLQLNFAWFGGEPLLGMPVIRAIAGHAEKLRQQHGFALTGGLTTNAYLLTTDVLAELLALRQNFFQVSLDGWGDVHDRTRRRADGRGTFDRIWLNLLAARDTTEFFDMVLRVHVTHDNHESLRTLCREIHREFGSDERFRVDFQDVRTLGGDGAQNVVNISAQTFHRIRAELDALARGATSAAIVVPETEQRRTGESATGRRAYEVESGEHYICYAAKPNHLLIRANGRVGKCTVALNDPRNDLGYINPDGTIVVDAERLRPWIRGFETMDIDQLGCPLKFIGDEAPQSPNSDRAIPVRVISDAALAA